MGIYRVPPPKNEPVLNYAPGSAEREGIKKALAELKANPIEIPMYIDGKEVRTGKRLEIRSPHNHKLLLGHYYQGGETEVKAAVDASMEAAKTWAYMPVGTSCGDLPESRRPDGRAVSLYHERRRHAGALQEYLPGRDRRRLRAGRFLPLQRLLHAADL